LIALDATLGLPAAAAVALALVGDRAVAATVNVMVCVATLIASIVLAFSVLELGPITAHGRLLYIDAFNVYLVVLTATMQSWPWFTVPLLSGLVIAFAGLMRHVQPMVFGEPTANMRALPVNMLPVAVHLVLVLWLGLAIPDFLAGWFDTAARLISGTGLL